MLRKSRIKSETRALVILALASPALPSKAASLVNNLGLGLDKSHDYPVYNESKPFSSFRTGSSSVELSRATFQLSTFSGFIWVNFNNMAISLYQADAQGAPQGLSIATTYGSGGFSDSTFDCPGINQPVRNWTATMCKFFTYDLSSFPTLDINSNYAIALSLPEDLSQPYILYWDFAATDNYSTNGEIDPLLSGNIDEQTIINLQSLYPSLNIASQYNFFELQGTIISPPPPSASAPGPLPIFGGAAAFGYSRKLRKRIKSQP